MSLEVNREALFYFTKWAETVMPSGPIAYPPMTGDYHHEAELVVAIGKGGRDIRSEDAAAHIYGYATGFDMMRRDLQLEARGKGVRGKCRQECGAVLPGRCHPPDQRNRRAVDRRDPADRQW